MISSLIESDRLHDPCGAWRRDCGKELGFIGSARPAAGHRLATSIKPLPGAMTCSRKPIFLPPYACASSATLNNYGRAERNGTQTSPWRRPPRMYKDAVITEAAMLRIRPAMPSNWNLTIGPAMPRSRHPAFGWNFQRQPIVLTCGTTLAARWDC